jgi:hypothetical protein
VRAGPHLRYADQPSVDSQNSLLDQYDNNGVAWNILNIRVTNASTHKSNLWTYVSFFGSTWGGLHRWLFLGRGHTYRYCIYGSRGGYTPEASPEHTYNYTCFLGTSRLVHFMYESMSLVDASS